MLCVLTLGISAEFYSLEWILNDRRFEKLLAAIFDLLSEFLPEICGGKGVGFEPWPHV